MSEGTFRKVGKSEKTLYGPRAVLVCGYEPAEQAILCRFLESIGMNSISVVFTGETDGACLLQELLARPDQSGRESSCTLDRAIILSGITENELQRILSAYAGLDLPRPLWATLTPYSEKWCLADLLAELKKERAAMEDKK